MLPLDPPFPRFPISYVEQYNMSRCIVSRSYRWHGRHLQYTQLWPLFTGSNSFCCPHIEWLSSMVPFGFVQFCSGLFGSVRFCSVLFGSVRFYSALFGSVLFGSVRFCSVLFGSVWFCSVLFGSVRFCSVLFGFSLFDLKRVPFGSVLFCSDYGSVWFSSVLCITKLWTFSLSVYRRRWEWY